MKFRMLMGAWKINEESHNCGLVVDHTYGFSFFYFAKLLSSSFWFIYVTVGSMQLQEVLKLQTRILAVIQLTLMLKVKSISQKLFRCFSVWSLMKFTILFFICLIFPEDACEDDQEIKFSLEETSNKQLEANDSEMNHQCTDPKLCSIGASLQDYVVKEEISGTYGFLKSNSQFGVITHTYYIILHVLLSLFRRKSWIYKVTIKFNIVTE